MRIGSFGATLLLAAASAGAQQAPVPSLKAERIAPVADPAAIPLYPGMGPGRVVERWNRMFDGQRAVRNVTQPTLTPVLPDPARATGAAVVVVPGGAFQFVSMDNEGWPVARRLADRGIAAFVLKYRTNETPDDEAAMMRKAAALFAGAGKPGFTEPSEPRATADAQAALRLIRARAAEWRVDPERVGALGFSAGAMTALNAAAATGGQRPDFIGYIYGPMLAPAAVPADAPPMFNAIALDDGLFGRQGFGIVEAWRRAGRPVELHAYERGDHGFGLGRAGTTTTGMLDQFVAWMTARGLMRR